MHNDSSRYLNMQKDMNNDNTKDEEALTEEDSNTDESTVSEKSNNVLATTIGGAVIGTVIAPTLPVALVFGVLGALIGSSAEKKQKK